MDAYSAIMGKTKIDLGALSDTELEGLMGEVQQENNRRNKLGNVNAALLKSRWGVAIFLLCIGFLVLFKAETSTMKDDPSDVVLAKPGEKGAWLIEPDHKQVSETDKEEAKGGEDDDNNSVNTEPAEETQEETEGDETEEETTAESDTTGDATEETTEEETTTDGSDTTGDTTEETMEEETTTDAEEESTTDAKEETTTEEQATDADVTEDETPTNETEETPDGPVVSDVPPADTIYPNFPWKKASDADKKAAFAKGTRPKVRYLYKRRCAHASGTCLLDIPAEKQKLAKQWGEWTLTDPKVADRPTEDFAKDFPNRDIPWDKFPSNAWQVDKDYLPNFLKESIDLTERALEGILAEYGRSKFDMPDKSFDERVEGSSFMIEVLDLQNETALAESPRTMKESNHYGGWITPEYFDGLVRRLMHSVITEDTFTMIMGGHSAAAGHGNHFQQSYTLQFFKVLEPIFARLGVKLHTSNFGYGGLGTGQSSLAAGDIYGKELDLYVWDSGMTERGPGEYDLYVRQAFLSGNRIPVLMGGLQLQKFYQDNVTREVGQFGDGQSGVTQVTDAVQAESIPWAGRYINCNAESHDLCRKMEYNGTCWIERPDYTPETKQHAEPGGRASWHPGYKQHAVRGRIIAFTVLRALREGLKQWKEAPDGKLPEEVWHVSKHYDSIRKGLEAVSLDPNDENGSTCAKLDKLPFKEFCYHPFNGVSEMTPRANPRENAIRNIMKPAYDGYLPVPMENVYNPPDVFNPTLAVPDGEFDYLAVVENGIDFREFLAFDNSPLPAGAESAGRVIKIENDKLKPGLGWGADSNANPDECDGTYDSFCSRGIDQECLLYGHNDRRGGLMFDSYSGWGVFTVPNVVLGKIAIRIEWWGNGKDNTRTADWEEENNGDPAYHRALLEEDDYTEYGIDLPQSNATNPKLSRRLGQPENGVLNQTDHRMLKGAELCDSFQFQMAVAKGITTYNKDDFREKLIIFQRVVQIQVVPLNKGLMDGKPWDVEVGFHMSGCEKKNSMKISHIYWA